MKKIIRTLFISLFFCYIGTFVYGFTNEPLSEDTIKNNLEETYGIDIIIVDNEEYISYKECLLILDSGLRRFPEGVIKEITEFYSNNGIDTRVIVSKTEKISDLFSGYELNEDSANIYITTLQNSLYNDLCVASEEGFVHEMGHYVSDYIFEVYDYEKLKSEFDKLNTGYFYGTWDEGYDKAFINKHSAMSLKDEVADLIWYTELHPDILRNVNKGVYTVIHEKIEFLSSVIEQSFSSITPDTKLWKDALPQKPDLWAEEAIQEMKKALLIPEEFDGLYNSYITKEDFYTLALNIIENKLGNENFIKSFDLVKQEDYMAIDPINGEIFVDNNNDNSNLDVEISNDKEKRLYEAYQIGLIDEGWIYGSKEYMTRLEIAKLFNYIGDELGMDISDYDVINYDDISTVKDSEKPFIYFVSNKGILQGDGTSFKPYDYCTYQEAYLMLLRFYNML